MAVERAKFSPAGVSSDLKEKPKKRESSDFLDNEEKPKKVSQRSETSPDLGNTSKDDDDEDIFAGVEEKGKNKNNVLFIVAAIGILLLVASAFLILGLGSKGKEEVVPQQQDMQQPVVQQPVERPTNDSNSDSSASTNEDNSLGTQDFTGNTNMTNSDILINPDKYVEDIYGLTTRVDYTVSQINQVADFVSYEKQRGTWGGGLELYWLDAEYKGQKYVIQIPFKYYKEIDEKGIVPVKMEVLTIEGSASGETLTVISYMSLDEDTLKNILKQQSK